MSRRVLLLVGAFAVLLLVFRLTTSSPSSIDDASSGHHHHDGIVTTEDGRHLTLKQQKQVKPSERQKQQRSSSLLNGVILYLSGGRWESYFTQHALPRLDEYFVSCFPYPVLVFHENAPESQKQQIRAALKKGNAAYQQQQRTDNEHGEQHIVRFDDVSEFWKHLPSSVSEQQLAQWMRDPTQRKFQGRGYRVMCRFWAGAVWLRKSLDGFDYYWRLDTDSILTRPLTVDPFRLVFIERKCVYGFNRLKGENPHVAVELFETFRSFLDNSDAVKDAHFSETEKQACIHWVTTRSDGVVAAAGKQKRFWAPMYYNNFEMGTMQLKRSALYQAFFRWVDEHPPYGIFRYRWGDAPLHTLGILVAQRCSVREFCNVTFDKVPYRHAVTKIPALMPRADGSCPAY